MGSCYSIPILIENPHYQIEDRSCVICLEKVVSHNIFIKCSKCHIFIHTLCAFEYKNTQPNIAILCPICKRKNALFIYDNDVYKL
jgi:hypothetical protein